MAGFSDVKDGTVDQYKRKMTRAGYTTEMIENVATDEEMVLAHGQVSLALAQRWLQPVEVKLLRPGLPANAIPGVKVLCRHRSGRHVYARQWYGDPSDTQDGIFTLLDDYKESMKSASDAPFEYFDLFAEGWTPFIPGWEALGLPLKPLKFLVRRIPSPQWWVKMAPGWEARFTQNSVTKERNFELRPALKIYP